MKTPDINTTKTIIPMVYAYTTPGVQENQGWTKIGYTESQTVDERIKQQTHTVGVNANEEWRGSAIFDDGTGEPFTDHDFHAFLTKNEIERRPKTEWFKVDGPYSENLFHNFKKNRFSGIKSVSVDPYSLREEQAEAVSMAKEHYTNDESGEVLWNCKPRFGKTLSTYDFVKQIGAQNVLIVTNRPAIANSWYQDYKKFLGTFSGYRFISTNDSIKKSKLVVNYNTFLQIKKKEPDVKLIYFLSLQDLKGSIHFGGKYDKLHEIKKINWDVLVIDEAHEGVDTFKTDIAFDNIKRKFTLHLSGTPFKALANDKFRQECIFNWTYADEQKRKREFEGADTNPYESLPRLNMYTYQMSEIIKEQLSEGIEINGETEEYAFDLNLFFETDGKGVFKHDEAVDRFLNALINNEKYPFSTSELRKQLKHTFWILNRVDSAKALAKKLKKHPVFENYEIVLAAGDGRLDDDDEKQKAYEKVTKAIAEHEKTITLSVGQLTTGVTIPEWSAVLMLSNMKSPSLYMQAAFRAQNPWKYWNEGKYYRKENAYLFDFDPARTLTIYEEFANDLSAETSDGRGDITTRKENVRELLNFFPVIGEDEEGEMVLLDAEKVLSIPRKIHSQEVVRRGFMSDFLFQNISNVFHVPQVIVDIINKFEPIKEPNIQVNIDESTADRLNINESGDVEIPEGTIAGKTGELFGEKIYEDITTKLDEEVDNILKEEHSQNEDPYKEIKEVFKDNAIKPLIDNAAEGYGSELKPSNLKRLQKKLETNGQSLIRKITGEHNIRKKEAKADFERKVRNAETDHDREKAQEEYDKKLKEADDTLKEKLSSAVDDYARASAKEIVRSVEQQKREDEKSRIETSIKDRLRGFSRTIPSFLMAYGDDKTTLKTFDEIVPKEVFIEVTSITLDEFRLLRDGGKITDENGQEKEFSGNLFNPVTFDDSVKEFLRLRKALADYFEETSNSDIFDYIPPQKTNQIFTPKKTVKEMVDLLEEENPGCFDNPDKTFIDMYMKSGLYITEIVKRLFNSSRLKELYPDREERLKHIFAKQVYGLAPTEIIYNISKNYILGFSDKIEIREHNLRQADALKLIEEGRLESYLETEFGGN